MTDTSAKACREMAERMRKPFFEIEPIDVLTTEVADFLDAIAQEREQAQPDQELVALLRDAENKLHPHSETAARIRAALEKVKP